METNPHHYDFFGHLLKINFLGKICTYKVLSGEMKGVYTFGVLLLNQSIHCCFSELEYWNIILIILNLNSIEIQLFIYLSLFFCFRHYFLWIIKMKKIRFKIFFRSRTHHVSIKSFYIFITFSGLHIFEYKKVAHDKYN